MSRNLHPLVKLLSAIEDDTLYLRAVISDVYGGAALFAAAAFDA